MLPDSSTLSLACPQNMWTRTNVLWIVVDVVNPNILTPSIVIWLVRPMLGQDNNDDHDNTIVPADDQNDMKYITVEEFFMKHSTLLH